MDQKEYEDKRNDLESRFNELAKEWQAWVSYPVGFASVKSSRPGQMERLAALRGSIPRGFPGLESLA
jgi:hypothetical protein